VRRRPGVLLPVEWGGCGHQPGNSDQRSPSKTVVRQVVSRHGPATTLKTSSTDGSEHGHHPGTNKIAPACSGGWEHCLSPKGSFRAESTKVRRPAAPAAASIRDAQVIRAIERIYQQDGRTPPQKTAQEKRQKPSAMCIAGQVLEKANNGGLSAPCQKTGRLSLESRHTVHPQVRRLDCANGGNPTLST